MSAALATSVETADQLADRLNPTLEQWNFKASVCMNLPIKEVNKSGEYVAVAALAGAVPREGRRQVSVWLKSQGLKANLINGEFEIREWGDTPKPSVGMEAISLAESRDLVRLEAVVEKGLETFVQVGEALAEIRDRRLYRIGHATFAEYCKAKWKMSDRRARQLMDGAEIASTIAESGTTVPKSERQTRPLAALPVAQRAEAWSAAVAAAPTGTPTAREVKIAVAKITQAPGAVRVMVETRRTNETHVEKTPLQWLTHWWMLASEEERRLFDNFRAGMRGGR